MRKLGTGVFHAGVAVHGSEWSFAGGGTGSGIVRGVPGDTSDHLRHKEVLVGVTTLKEGEALPRARLGVGRRRQWDGRRLCGRRSPRDRRPWDGRRQWDGQTLSPESLARRNRNMARFLHSMVSLIDAPREPPQLQIQMLRATESDWRRISFLVFARDSEFD